MPELLTRLVDAIAVLTERERVVIYHRFGPKKMTLRAIGLIIDGVTKERVRQIQNAALAKLGQMDWNVNVPAVAHAIRIPKEPVDA